MRWWTFTKLYCDNHFTMYVSQSFPGGSDGKESACNVGDQGSIPGQWRSLEEENDNPLQYSHLDSSMDRGAWQTTVHGVTKSQTRLCDWAHIYTYKSDHYAIRLKFIQCQYQPCLNKTGRKKDLKKKKKPGPSPCTTRSFRAASRMVTTMRPPCVLGSRGPELLCLPSTFQSSHACFIYKVQGVWLYLAEGEIDIRGIGPHMSISSSQERKFPELPWLSSG